MNKLAVLLLLLIPFSAFAGGNDDCDHPRFLEKGCDYEGRDGKDGEDGKDGQDGQDGRDGKDGRDGVDGKDGKDGKDGADGVVPTEWINETRNWQRSWGRFSAANESIQIYLPQDQDHRVTFGMARVHGNTGLGVGYAYKTPRDDNLAFTVGLGTSGGQTVGKVSVGFEFGGDSRSQPKFDEPEVIILPEPAEYIEPIAAQQQMIEDAHNEDMQMVQMAQLDINDRLNAIETELAKPKPKTKPVVTKQQALFTEEQKAAVTLLFEDVP